MISGSRREVCYLFFSGEFDFVLVQLVRFVLVVVAFEPVVVWDQMANLVPVGLVAMVVVLVMLVVVAVQMVLVMVLVMVVVVVRHPIADPVSLAVVVWVCFDLVVV